MAITTTGDIPSLLKAGLAAVFGEYPKYQAQWSEIFSTYRSDKQVEQEVEMQYLPVASYRPEGAPTDIASMQQKYVTTYVHKYFSIGMIISRMAVMDNLYKSYFPMIAQAINDALDQAREIMGASIFNNGFNPAFPLGDCQPFFSLLHPITGGTVANTPVTPVDLSEASIEQALIAIHQFKDQAGLTIKTKAVKLLVPATGEYVADRLLGSQFRTNTDINDISAIFNTKAVPQGYRVNQFLSLLFPNAWYLLTDAPNSLKFYRREDIDTDVYTEPLTNNLIITGTERYSFGVSNFRGAYGSQGM